MLPGLLADLWRQPVQQSGNLWFGVAPKALAGIKEQRSERPSNVRESTITLVRANIMRT